MKKTYEIEEIDRRGNVVRKVRMTIEDEYRPRNYEYDGRYGDGRSPFINRYSRHEDIRDYDKYSDIMPHSSMKDILDSYEELLDCINWL